MSRNGYSNHVYHRYKTTEILYCKYDRVVMHLST